MDRPDAFRQLKRFAGLEFFQGLPEEAMEELATALCRAPDLALATTVVSEWLATQTKRPTPADLNRLIHKHQGHHAVCEICCDTGIVIVDGLFAACTCETGQREFVQDWVGKVAV